MSFFGLDGGEVTAVMENQAGKRVFEQKYPFVNMYTGDSTPACYTDSSSQKDSLKPYDVASGPHVLRLLYKGQEFYSLKFRFNTVVDYGVKSVYVTGDWEKMALLALSAQSPVRVEVYGGGPDVCGGSGVNAQVQLYRDSNFVAMGHFEGAFYTSCSTLPASFTLFSVDEGHFSKCVSADDILNTEGDYELKYLIDRNLIKTYAFTVSGGKAASGFPRGLQEGLAAEKLRPYPPDAWIYTR